MFRAVLAALLAASLAACAGAQDQRPAPTVGGEQRAPATAIPQPPDNYP